VISTSIKSVAMALSLAAVVQAQGRRGGPPAGPRSGTIERATIAGSDVTVYLPPDYASDAARRFPVVYLIAERPVDSLKSAADELASAPGFSEPIVVMTSSRTPDALVADVDMRYRTIAARISRGLSGYALGGDAALRAAMKRPDVFSSLYLLSASIVDATVAMVDGAAPDLRRLYGISVSIGTGDPGLAMNRRLHDAMTRAHVPHYYEEFDGTLAERAAERIETRVLTFFSKSLTAPANPTSPAVQ
jgi:hypothetical protein